MERSRIGFVVGLTAEARLLRGTGFMVEVGGGEPAGAVLAARRLVARNAGALVSFGLAGGLNPKLMPGDLVIPRSVRDDGDILSCDNALLEMLGGADCGLVVASQGIAASIAEKRWLFEDSSADAVDLESGSVARVATANNLPFAVLRAVADPAWRDLPPAALIALNGAGTIQILSVLASVFRKPVQIPGLLTIARDAAKARSALIKKLNEMQSPDPGP